MNRTDSARLSSSVARRRVTLPLVLAALGLLLSLSARASAAELLIDTGPGANVTPKKSRKL